jgi:predicted ABC-type transport system involved in lysophospholipase L1 biosynthesis ATPase subunit
MGLSERVSTHPTGRWGAPAVAIARALAVVAVLLTDEPTAT